VGLCLVTHNITAPQQCVSLHSCQDATLVAQPTLLGTALNSTCCCHACLLRTHASDLDATVSCCMHLPCLMLFLDASLSCPLIVLSTACPLSPPLVHSLCFPTRAARQELQRLEGAVVKTQRVAENVITDLRSVRNMPRATELRAEVGSRGSGWVRGVHVG
jgi:hypothetical protein